MSSPQAPAATVRTPADSAPLVPLSRLRTGQSAVIGRIVGRAEDVHRLEEFGFRHGTPVEVFRQGIPCILRLAGGKVCLRADRSLKILVVPRDAAS